MADAILVYLQQDLPPEVAQLTDSHLKWLHDGEYDKLLHCNEASMLFGHDPNVQFGKRQDFTTWSDYTFHRLGTLSGDRTEPARLVILFCIGYAAMLAFVQSNVTGPPLDFQPSKVLFPDTTGSGQDDEKRIRRQLLEGLTVDGIAAYKLTPHLELLCLADAVMTCPPILKHVNAARWAKMRVAFFQQRLLPEVSSTLQEVIYNDLELLEQDLKTLKDEQASLQAEFLLERATIHIHHGFDKLAREDLKKATISRRFDFALTGLLGKRTKYQQKDTSQLVVLAVSERQNNQNHSQTLASKDPSGKAKPSNLDLNDDTLLESISFTERPAEKSLVEMQTADDLSKQLRELDLSSQPQLQPLDSIILLLSASSIVNTSPADGLTRESTVPYATRVLEGGSSNWQVYTQALLVRSRIEGYKSRTIERGLLQLQTLVDQVIAETTSNGSSGNHKAQAGATSSTFLPKATESESASVADRMRYIFQLAFPTRWELESELAQRWVQLGGLRSALEIYERLELWAEVAVCWMAVEREDKAEEIVRRQLFHSSNSDAEEDGNTNADEEWNGPARDPPPLDAPRLYCILGDIDQSIEMYEKAWSVSNERYARAQRSIGRHFFTAGNMAQAAEAYAKSLKVNQLNQQSWFALGCAYLELAQFEDAVEAFSRCVQLDETDAESWSNLAAALLRIDPEKAQTNGGPNKNHVKLDDEDDSTTTLHETAASKHIQLRQDALKALKRAASLKHDSHQIWENVLIVAASLPPPDYTTILSAQKRLVDLRGPTIGERAIDVEILGALINHIISLKETYDPAQPGLSRMVVKFVDQNVTPLITASAELWHLVGRLALWRNKPFTALEAEEKAWRAVTAQPGWEASNDAKRWEVVVEATVRLCDAYETFGPRERTEGMAAESGEVVMKDWKFKARSAVRGIMGKGKGSYEGTDGWERLKEVLEALRG